MSLTPKNTANLISPENFKFKILVCSIPGSGKTEYVGSAEGVGVAACETGEGSGILTVARRGVNYVEPENYSELESFCSGNVFKELPTLAIDSLSAMTRTFIKDYAITNFPRSKGETPKRRAGILELDDYNTVGECTRRLLAKLIKLPKHIIVTTTLRLPQEARPEEGRVAQPAMPDLPGQLALASSAMFDATFILRTRPALRDPKDAKTRYTQRYWITEGNDQWHAKSRLVGYDGKAIFTPEVIFDKETGEGSFPWMLSQIQQAYSKPKV